MICHLLQPQNAMGSSIQDHIKRNASLREPVVQASFIFTVLSQVKLLSDAI